MKLEFKSKLRRTFSFTAAFILAGCVTTPKQAHDTVYMDQSFTVDVTECLAEGGSQKSLILLPPTGGTNIIDRSYAKQFCNAGWNVYVLNDFSHPGESTLDLSRHESGYRNSQHAIELTLQKIKTPFIGVMGTSLGVTYAAVAANTFAQVNAVFMIVGGVPFAEVIATSDHPSMTSLKKGRIEKKMIAGDDASYIAALDKQIKLEPTRLGDAHLAKDIGVVISSNDTTVPFATQKKLVDFFKPKTVIELSSSHFWAIVKTWWSHSREVQKFFDDSAETRAKGES